MPCARNRIQTRQASGLQMWRVIRIDIVVSLHGLKTLPCLRGQLLTRFKATSLVEPAGDRRQVRVADGDGGLAIGGHCEGESMWSRKLHHELTKCVGDPVLALRGSRGSVVIAKEVLVAGEVDPCLLGDVDCRWADVDEEIGQSEAQISW